MNATVDGPRISVLIPAHDAASTLEVCLRSVERQTDPGWECVVADDGSRDGSAAILERLARRDPRFRILTLPRRGLVAALNAGLEVCRGRFVARMDADDLMHSGRLADQAALLESREDLVATGSHVRLFPRHVLGTGYREYEAWINGMRSAECIEREAYVECPVVHPSMMIRREALVDLGYRDRGWPEDYDLVLRLLSARERIGTVPRRLLCWRRGPRTLSARDPVYAPDRFTACKAEFLAGNLLAGADRYILWGYGSTGRALRRALAGHGKVASHIVELHPGRVGNRIHGAPVVPPGELIRLPRRPLIASVAGHGPRNRIRAALAAYGFEELRDYVCAA